MDNGNSLNKWSLMIWRIWSLSDNWRVAMTKRLQKVNVLRFLFSIISLFACSVLFSAFFYLPVFPFLNVTHLILSNEIMRFAIKVPIANWRTQWYSFPIKSKFPVRWGKRGHNFVPAPAGTPVNCGTILDRDVQNTWFDIVRNKFNKSVGQFH